MKNNRRKVWICWDLSNGHWKDHCYVWIYPTRWMARWKKRLHRSNSNYHTLSTPKKAFMDNVLVHSNVSYYHIREVVGLSRAHPTYPYRPKKWRK